MLDEILLVVAGIVVILVLASLIIRSVVKLSKHFGLSGTFVGLTILSIGTSIPEIMSAVVASINIVKNPASLQALSSLVVGQNVGSDIFQQSFILAIVGILGTVVVVKKDLFKEMGALIIGALLVFVFSLGGTLSRIEGGVLLAVYAGYLYYLYRNRSGKIVAAKNLSRRRVWIEILIVTISFVIMGIVADKVLFASTVLVQSLPVSASFFGVVLLGIASALPELMTALVAVFKRQKGISAGVLIGSNITNPLFGLGLGALISTYSIPDVLVQFDLPIKIGTGLLIYYFLFRSEDITKVEGIILICLFFAYIFIRAIHFPADL